MDAASQRGIDDVREIRERAVLQPVEGGYKVYIIDEAHQLTPQAWNALLKLIEEPPPHLVFVFCTTDLASVLPTVRSRCQTFVFQRPRLQELVAVLRRVCDGEEIDAPDAALALIARGAHGSFRDAVSTLDQLAAATGSTISVQDVLQLVGGIEEDSLFRLCDTIIDRDTAGALVQIEELAEQGQDIGRLVDRADRASPPPPARAARRPRARVAPRHRGDARAAARAGEPAARADGAAPRSTCSRSRSTTCARAATHACRSSSRSSRSRGPRPTSRATRSRTGSSCSRRAARGAPAAAPRRCDRRGTPVDRRSPHAAPVTISPAEEPPAASTGLPLRIDRAARPAAARARPAPRRLAARCRRRGRERSIPISTLLAEARPVEIRGDTLTIEFAPAAGLPPAQIEDPKNLALLREALYEVTGRRLTDRDDRRRGRRSRSSPKMRASSPRRT